MKNNSHSAKDGRILTSILKRMLLILLFLANLAPTIQAEEVERQQNTGISINVSNVSLKNLFNILEQKSNYIFFYSNDAISGTKNTSIRTENEAITSILDKVLPPKQLTYTIKGRQIIVSRVKDVEKTVVPVAAPKNFRLKGKVVDAARQPLPGANVVVNGQGGAAAITDLDGNFTLDIEGRDKVQLSISYIGFQTKSISTGETVKPLFVVLEENAAALSEVVVVGYGTQKKLNLTGAVATASGDILSDRPIGNIAQGLQGVIPNL
ncbi:MAG: carboxypeptidase-like regulatory domain-containing protein, partial [Bacteroidaceae bacterium]